MKLRFSVWPLGRMLILASLLVICGASFSQERRKSVSLAPVTVIGFGGSVQARFSDLWNGYKVFIKARASAPHASLKFFVEDTSASPAMPPLEIKFETGDSYYEVRVNEDGYFTLPGTNAIDAAGSLMLANRKQGTVRIHPIVRTSGDGSASTHLGELRLECEVSWAIQKGSAPLYIRSAFFLGGRACHSKNISMQFYSPEKLKSITMSSDDRTRTLGAGRNQHDYWPPIYDKSWPDSTVVDFDR